MKKIKPKQFARNAILTGDAQRIGKVLRRYFAYAREKKQAKIYEEAKDIFT